MIPDPQTMTIKKRKSPTSMVPDPKYDHQKKKKIKLTLLDSLMGLGLNLLGLDPLVQGFESDHRHWDKILKNHPSITR
jgi:hypothetical protein